MNQGSEMRQKLQGGLQARGGSPEVGFRVVGEAAQWERKEGEGALFQTQ